jgi:hypothetical protein
MAWQFRAPCHALYRSWVNAPKCGSFLTRHGAFNAGRWLARASCIYTGDQFILSCSILPFVSNWLLKCFRRRCDWKRRMGVVVGIGRQDPETESACCTARRGARDPADVVFSLASNCVDRVFMFVMQSWEESPLTCSPKSAQN